MSKLLLEGIKKRVVLTPGDEEKILAVCTYRKVKKKRFVLQEGEVLKHMIFVEEGCLRSYSVDNNGFDHILQFAPPGWWISDMRSLLDQTPASINIDAVDDSAIVLIPQSDTEALFDAIPALDRFFRLLLERTLAVQQHRVIDALSLSAKERYNNFCKQYPSLISCLPQKYVAAYIGITPEFLSKMLKQPMNR